MIPGAREDKEQSQKKLIEGFPCEIFQKEDYFDTILIRLEKIRKELIESYGPKFLSQIDIIVFEINNVKRLNCNDIFCLFLIYVFRFVSVSFYREIVFFIVCYRIMLNETGWQKCKQMNESFEIDINREFCEANSAEYVPDFANDFVMDYFSICIQTERICHGVDKFVYLGLDAEKLLRLILITKYFCRWLYIHKFTKAKTTIVQD